MDFDVAALQGDHARERTISLCGTDDNQVLDAHCTGGEPVVRAATFRDRHRRWSRSLRRGARGGRVASFLKNFQRYSRHYIVLEHRTVADVQPPLSSAASRGERTIGSRNHQGWRQTSTRRAANRHRTWTHVDSRTHVGGRSGEVMSAIGAWVGTGPDPGSQRKT
jgi:hypothetical protein